MADRETLDVYGERAGDYRDRFASAEPDQGMRDFLDVLPRNAHVLDLGCGPGQALVHLSRAGHHPEGVDAVPEFVDLARKASGAPVSLGTFDTLNANALYDGIYANFSLLHAPKADMPAHLSRIARALKPEGVFHLGLKTGTGEHRDKIGRFYAYYAVEEIQGLLAQAGFSILKTRTGEDPGLDGTVAPWVVLLTRISK